MNTHDHDSDRFDQAMRDVHAQAVDRISPATRARLRAARHAVPATPVRRGLGWVLASGFAAVFALAIGLRLQTPTPAVAPPAPSVAALTPATAYDVETAVAALDENPDLYLWLAANDDDLPLGEQ